MRFFASLKITMVLAALLITGSAAWAQSFTIEASYSSSTKKTTFTITRSGSNLPQQTINYRTVSLSAYAGQHYTAVSDSYTFPANETTKKVVVSESAPGTNAYKFQDGTNERSYRFEVLDQNGFNLASYNRTITNGLTSINKTNAYAKKTLNVIGSTAITVTDGGYKQAHRDVTVNNYYSNTAPKEYFTTAGAQLRMYVTFDARESDDGYQYIQIYANTTADDDHTDTGAEDGDPGSYNYARYVAGFTIDGNVSSTYYTYTFPVAAYGHNCGYKAHPWSGNSNGNLEQQYFKSGCRSTADGRLIIPTELSNLYVRFDASGNFDDDWYCKNLDAHIEAFDITNPTLISTSAISVSGGPYNRGNTFYISIPFSEIVTISGSTKKLSTEWGDAVYESGSGTNVLTFKGTINASAGTTLVINGLTGTISDFSSKNFTGSVSKTFTGITSADPDFSITYDLAGGTLATSNPETYKYSSSSFTLNNPARTGYYFDGWTGSNGNTPQTTVTIANHSHENKTYTANWTKVWTGSGTQGDPYVITTTKGLDLLALYVNGLEGNTAHDCSGVYFQLGGNITYTHTTDWNDASSTENNYTAIGTDNNRFQGTFDGQGHTVSGIRNYRGGSNSADKNQGIFGYIGSGGTVRGVNLADARITGYNNVGGIAGYIFNATVEDCTVAADVCIHAVQSNSKNHGGIVGGSQGTVQSCLSRATLSVANATGCNEFGAIAGNVQGNIYDCIAIGAIVPDVSNAGSLFGYYNGNPRRNYYRACTVAGTPNATDVGVGSDSGNSSPHDLTANQGAQALYSITLPDGVSLVRSASATLPGTGNKTYTTGADIDGTPYAYDGATLRLSYTGAALAAGYVYGLFINGTRATDNGNGTYTATMPAADATITVSIVPIDFTADGHSGDSEADAYIIYNKDQLDLLAKMVNGTDGYDANTFENKFIKLANDIEYHPATDWNDVTSQEHNFTAIGRYSGNTNYYFQGTFDGDNHTVSGVRIYKNSDTSADSYQGLFGNVGSSGTVKNVIVSDARITGYYSAGGIVGQNKGDVINCHAAITVAIASVINKPALYHGGIVGDNVYGIIRNCTSAATLTANNQSAWFYGAITGWNEGRIENCHAVYAIITAQESYYGVITGYNQNGGILTDNYYRGCTVGDTANAVNVGVGNGDGAPADQTGARSVHALTLPAGITASGESVDIDATTYYAAGTTVTLSHGSAPAGYETFEGYSLDGTPIDGNAFTMPAADATVTARWTTKDFTSDHEGTEADPFIIYNKDQLNQLASLVNNGACNGYSKKFIKLGADIEYDGTENNFTPIGNNPNAFRGTFDGDGHTISGIVITGGNDYQGLFGHISNVSKIGAVKNLTLANSSISGKDYVGGIVGRSASLVSNCHVENSVTIKTGNNNSTYHGGIVGQNNGTIQGCISSASVLVNGLNGCRKYGGITGGSASNKTIENCLAAGAIVENTASSGAIVGETASYLRHNYYSDCSIGEASSNVGCYMDSRTSSIKYGDITDNDGAVRAVSSTTKPAEIGAQIATYSGGLTVYEHGAYYNGTYYLRHDLAGTAVGLNLTQGTKDGVSAYWGTYYNGTTNHTLVGATAYTLGTDYKLYRLGTDGRTIPKGVAVVIIATSGDASLIPAGTGNLSITDHAPGGNILVGNDADTDYAAIYVLSVNSSGEVGFCKLSIGDLPAHKAGYERRAGMQDYDKQDNQEW